MVSSWGNFPKQSNIIRKLVLSRYQNDLFEQLPVLPYGAGRSYGDSCLNAGGTVLDTRYLNHFLDFDMQAGSVRCESGVTLADILAFAVPKGWMLPVLPGTQFVTLGGAIANDVHGKNHHLAGTFGCHVVRFELLRSNGERLICSSNENSTLFSATIGGLGLTGFITWAEIQLQKIPSPFLAVDTIAFETLEEFIALSKQAESEFEFTVAWLDCQARGKQFGRGLLMRANYLPTEIATDLQAPKSRLKSIPCFMPSWLLNPWTVRGFNSAYFALGKKKGFEQITHFQPFFFPLDSIQNWNRIYGRKGFLQYQCAVPFEGGLMTLKAMLKRIATSGQGSFLSVLKTFGEKSSPGLMSFPQPGLTLALDFPNRGYKTLQLLNELDKQLEQVGGRLYPAKDARMSATLFKQGYPNLAEFCHYIDPGFSSSFWQRITHNKEFH